MVSVNWNDKVRRIVEAAGIKLSHIEKCAKWPRNRLSAAMSSGAMPASDAGVRLARALGVPAEWLFDDEQDWPPPRAVSAESLDADARDAIAAELRRALRRLDEVIGQDAKKERKSGRQ